VAVLRQEGLRLKCFLDNIHPERRLSKLGVILSVNEHQKRPFTVK